jgi:hypothetical protein
VAAALGSQSAASSNFVDLTIKQPSIDASFQNLSQSDIRVVNEATLDMAIADMCHCENLPDAFVESDRFKLVLKLAKLVNNNYKPPGRKKVGGELLDLNFKSCQEKNMESILKEASTFGLSFLSDGATVKKMPLLNVLGMCAGAPPVTVAIIDATEHLHGGGGGGGRRMLP